MNTHLFTIKRRDESQPMSTANCLILMDGRELKSVTRFEFSLDANKQPIVAEVSLKLYASIELNDVLGEIEMEEGR